MYLSVLSDSFILTESTATLHVMTRLLAVAALAMMTSAAAAAAAACQGPGNSGRVPLCFVRPDATSAWSPTTAH